MRIWKVLNKNKIEMALVVLALLAAAFMAIFKPFNPITVGYFTDIATVLLILIAVLLFSLGYRRSVV